MSLSIDPKTSSSPGSNYTMKSRTLCERMNDMATTACTTLRNLCPKHEKQSNLPTHTPSKEYVTAATIGSSAA